MAGNRRKLQRLNHSSANQCGDGNPRASITSTSRCRRRLAARLTSKAKRENIFASRKRCRRNSPVISPRICLKYETTSRSEAKWPNMADGWNSAKRYKIIFMARHLSIVVVSKEKWTILHREQNDMKITICACQITSAITSVIWSRRKIKRAILNEIGSAPQRKSCRLAAGRHRKAWPLMVAGAMWRAQWAESVSYRLLTEKISEYRRLEIINEISGRKYHQSVSIVKSLKREK